MDTTGDVADRRDTNTASLLVTGGEVAGRRDTDAEAKAAEPAATVMTSTSWSK